MAASQIRALCEMPLNEEFKGLRCRTGNYMLFHFFHLRHRLPGSAARIIAQNFASCRLACSFMVAFLLVFTIFHLLSSLLGLGDHGLRHNFTIYLSGT
jgi:hypothetical protein